MSLPFDYQHFADVFLHCLPPVQPLRLSLDNTWNLAAEFSTFTVPCLYSLSQLSGKCLHIWLSVSRDWYSLMQHRTQGSWTCVVSQCSLAFILEQTILYSLCSELWKISKSVLAELAWTAASLPKNLVCCSVTKHSKHSLCRGRIELGGCSRRCHKRAWLDQSRGCFQWACLWSGSLVPSLWPWTSALWCLNVLFCFFLWQASYPQGYWVRHRDVRLDTWQKLWKKMPLKMIPQD